MNSNKKRIAGITFLIGIVLIILAVYFYYQQEINDKKRKQTVSDVTTELYSTTEIQEKTTDEGVSVIENESSTEELKQEASTSEKKQNKKLPDNYEWDEKQWGEPPQIIYDFAENQEKFEYIVNKIDKIVSKGDGYVADLNGGTIYYNNVGEDIKDKRDGNYDEFISDVVYILKNTKFNNIVKKESGKWVIEYDQEEDVDKYIYTMRYAPEMTEEEAWDNGYMKVVGDWYFATVWKI